MAFREITRYSRIPGKDEFSITLGGVLKVPIKIAGEMRQARIFIDEEEKKIAIKFCKEGGRVLSRGRAYPNHVLLNLSNALLAIQRRGSTLDSVSQSDDMYIFTFKDLDNDLD